ncbi:preprotein translocase subunit SecG [Parasediminibacterium sp. JCM 36343]|uniref:preprotein translocase subunit SecG n=1 Tax=Parasediminibacterium sp. JCM 36343 TaxID=3374279 RepID=UPI00397A6644
MVYLFLILIVIACVGLGFVVLVQNPKGGGLSGTVGGLNNNVMGVKQTTDVLEKGTWMFAGIIAVLALTSTLFLKGGGTSVDNSLLQKVNTTNSAPASPLKK